MASGGRTASYQKAQQPQSTPNASNTTSATSPAPAKTSRCETPTTNQNTGVMVTVGTSISLPMMGSYSVAAGVSHKDGQWDAGATFERSLPGVSWGNLYATKGTVEVTVQEGDFVSNHNSVNQSMSFGAGPIGAGVQKSIDGCEITGAKVSFGKQIGVDIAPTLTSSFSLRKDGGAILEALQQALPPAKNQDTSPFLGMP